MIAINSLSPGTRSAPCYSFIYNTLNYCGMRKIQLPPFLYYLGIAGCKSHRVRNGRAIHGLRAQRVYFWMKTKEYIRVWPNVLRMIHAVTLLQCHWPKQGQWSEKDHCLFPVKAQKNLEAWRSKLNQHDKVKNHLLSQATKFKGYQSLSCNDCCWAMTFLNIKTQLQ